MARPTFPKTLRQFRERFAEEADCCECLIRSRWPEGMICPRCQGRDFWRRSRRWLHQCRGCGFEVSPTAGPLLQDSHRRPCGSGSGRPTALPRPPRAWSAKQLQRQLGCSYKTAWYRLHRLRRAMVNQARSKLRGGGHGSRGDGGGAQNAGSGSGGGAPLARPGRRLAGKGRSAPLGSGAAG